MAEEETVTQREVLVAESDDAYDKAQIAPTENQKILAFLEVLVAEAKVDRFDRENPFDLGGIVWGLDDDEDLDFEDA